MLGRVISKKNGFEKGLVRAFSHAFRLRILGRTGQCRLLESAFLGWTVLKCDILTTNRIAVSRHGHLGCLHEIQISKHSSYLLSGQCTKFS